MTDSEGEGLADPNTLVLLGAGASVDAGFPTSVQLHDELLQRLDPVYENLADLVFKGGERPDPERLFRVLEFLNSLEVPELGYEARDIASLVGAWHSDIAQYFDGGQYRIQGRPLQRTIDDLWRALVDIFTLQDIPTNARYDYLRHLASQMRGQTVVTLNYDDAFEHMAYSMTYQIDARPFQQVRAGYPTGKPLRLVKLHGSLDWSREASTGDVAALGPMDSFKRNRELWQDHTPGIIFGAGNKLRPDGPFLALFQEFVDALAVAKQVVVIGYSFRDAHVNEALRRWILYVAEADALLRIGDVDENPLLCVNQWCEQRDFDVEFIRGPASEKIDQLIAPRPRLMKRQGS